MAGKEPTDNVIGRGRWPPSRGGSGPHDPTIEGRLAHLEAVVEEIRKELQAIRLDLTRMDGRLSNLPTTLQLVFMQAAFILAAFAAAFAVMRH
jgi:hypothetical protein